ncbi:hypothetical protein [Micromonospora sediminimaris]|uniref:Uncharacterized protein n=1 Tax=Micromonospora sediminimaris TaxID=547162 RepID=A0A9W5XIK4_9ACTN|nr:hypothetical protein [Micromonospora sediminimaris]GIJ32451.1 hypothetical protein Vse01_15990 [Micromonospora sediminimaris]
MTKSRIRPGDDPPGATTGGLTSNQPQPAQDASTVEDLNTWLDADLLRRLWPPTLWLPRQLRGRWEEAFPELAATRSNAA